MDTLPVKIHDKSLGRMQRIFCGLLVLPPRPQLLLKLIYNITLLAYLIILHRTRFAFQYKANYDFLHDHLSRIIDLTNFMALIVGHLIIAMELIWRNRCVQIDQQFQQIHFILEQKLGRKLNLRRPQLYSNIIYGFLLLRVIPLMCTTLYSYITTDATMIMIWNFYSELILILRCSEFTLNSALVLFIYQELCEASHQVISELEVKNQLCLQKIQVLRELHQLLWKVQREIESNFEKSLIAIMMKYFVDTSVIPYWVFLGRHQDNKALHAWLVSEEIGKLIEIFVPCWICTRSDQFHRKYRSLFHGVSKHRYNEDLNTALIRISAQLGQEKCRFRIGGLITINNDMLGKFLFGAVCYIFICIQFRINFKEAQEAEAEEQMHLWKNHTESTTIQ